MDKLRQSQSSSGYKPGPASTPSGDRKNSAPSCTDHKARVGQAPSVLGAAAGAPPTKPAPEGRPEGYTGQSFSQWSNDKPVSQAELNALMLKNQIELQFGNKIRQLAPGLAKEHFAMAVETLQAQLGPKAGAQEIIRAVSQYLPKPRAGGVGAGGGADPLSPAALGKAIEKAHAQLQTYRVIQATNEVGIPGFRDEPLPSLNAKDYI